MQVDLTLFYRGFFLKKKQIVSQIPPNFSLPPPPQKKNMKQKQHSTRLFYMSILFLELLALFVDTSQMIINQWELNTK